MPISCNGHFLVSHFFVETPCQDLFKLKVKPCRNSGNMTTAFCTKNMT